MLSRIILHSSKFGWCLRSHIRWKHSVSTFLSCKKWWEVGNFGTAHYFFCWIWLDHGDTEDHANSFFSITCCQKSLTNPAMLAAETSNTQQPTGFGSNVMYSLKVHSAPDTHISLQCSTPLNYHYRKTRCISHQKCLEICQLVTISSSFGEY